jgi:formiminoglutamate deiminase
VGWYWCELAWLGGDTATADVLLQTAGERIVDVQTGVDCPPGAVRLAGLTLPGFANAHSHAFHRALRGRAHTGAGSFWTWREQMYAAASRLNPDSYFELARAVYGEMALAGVTCVGEFHYLHHGPGGIPYDEPNAMGAALIAAAAEAGIRITVLDTCYLRGGIGVEPNEVQQRFSDGDALSWATRATALRGMETAMCKVAAAIHSVRAVPPAAMQVVGAWAARDGLPLHAHVSEQPAENERCIDVYGLTPTALLAERGALSERFTAVHATHLAVADIELYGSHRCTICMCPTTERDLADGIGPALMLRNAGARLALGSDSHAVIDMFEEARAVEMDERLASQIRGSHDAPSLLRAATAQGCDSLGWGDAGTLRVGGLADFVAIRLDTVRVAGWTPSTVIESATFAAAAVDVHTVVVGGATIVADGRHARFDVSSALHASITSLMDQQ